MILLVLVSVGLLREIVSLSLDLFLSHSLALVLAANSLEDIFSFKRIFNVFMAIM